MRRQFPGCPSNGRAMTRPTPYGPTHNASRAIWPGAVAPLRAKNVGRNEAACLCAGALTAHAAATFGPTARRFDDAAVLAATLAEAPEAASLLVKGSRFMRMERVVRAIEDAVEREVAGGPAAEGGEDDACC